MWSLQYLASSPNGNINCSLPHSGYASTTQAFPSEAELAISIEIPYSAEETITLNDSDDIQDSLRRALLPKSDQFPQQPKDDLILCDFKKFEPESKTLLPSTMQASHESVIDLLSTKLPMASLKRFKPKTPISTINKINTRPLGLNLDRNLKVKQAIPKNSLDPPIKKTPPFLTKIFNSFKKIAQIIKRTLERFSKLLKQKYPGKSKLLEEITNHPKNKLSSNFNALDNPKQLRLRKEKLAPIKTYQQVIPPIQKVNQDAEEDFMSLL
ncbi:hypothetical protein O181_092527, partial [Austropuccinia psidii MF-1]|nr:hypothetical protein [Austropuccinia psidii MF-1]